MGSKSDQTLKEIEALRSGLDRKLNELQHRLPPVAQIGRKAVAIALGGGAGGTALWVVARRLRGKGKQKRAEAATPSVSVKVLPAGAVPAAVAIAAVWAGVRIFEARMRAGRRRASEKPAVVRPLPRSQEA
jgi:hypothetical protein